MGDMEKKPDNRGYDATVDVISDLIRNDKVFLLEERMRPGTCYICGKHEPGNLVVIKEVIGNVEHASYFHIYLDSYKMLRTNKTAQDREQQV